jgi:phage gp29-like protein
MAKNRPGSTASVAFAQAPALAAKPMLGMSAPEIERLVVPKALRQIDTNLLQVTPGGIDSALSNREQGYPQKWVDLCDRMQTNPTLSFAFETRKRAVAGRPLNVAEPDDVPPELRGYAREAAALVKEWLAGIGDLEAFVMRIMDAWMSGLHVSELMWERRHGVWLPTPAQVYTRECEWDWDNTVKCRGADYRWVRTADHPSKFLAFVPQTSGRSPACQGIGDRVVWYWFMLGTSIKFWMIAAERFGSPLAVAKLASESNAETRGAIALQLQSLMTTSTAVLTGDDALEIIDGKAAGTAGVWSELTKLFTDQICYGVGTTPDVLMVGPNGLGSAGTNARDGVRLESSKLDAKMVCAALSQIARWVVWWNLRRDDSRGLPLFSVQFDDARTVSAQAVSAGVVRKNELRAGEGLPPLADGGDAFVVTTPAPVGLPGTAYDPNAEPDGVKVADAALNGAQGMMLSAVIKDVAAGLMPRDSAIAQLMLMFQVSSERATELLGSAGAGFVPANPATGTPAVVPPAAAAPPTPITPGAPPAPLSTDAPGSAPAASPFPPSPRSAGGMPTL